MLAGIPQSPSNYSPLANTKLAKKRQKTVLTLMVNNDVITNEESIKAFNEKGVYKSKRTQEILGCDFEYFNKYLLQTFKDNYGYEWDGIEPIHIDHKKPLKYAKTEEELIKLNHYTNLQLLKAEDNLKKGSKINYKIN